MLKNNYKYADAEYVDYDDDDNDEEQQVASSVLNRDTDSKANKPKSLFLCQNV